MASANSGRVLQLTVGTEGTRLGIVDGVLYGPTGRELQRSRGEDRSTVVNRLKKYGKRLGKAAHCRVRVVDGGDVT